MSVRYSVEMSVGYVIRMSAQVAQGDLGIWIAYTETRGGIAALACDISNNAPDDPGRHAYPMI